MEGIPIVLNEQDSEWVNLIRQLVTNELGKIQHNLMIPVALSNRHIHLSREDFSHLFGLGANMHELRSLSQPGQFACQETVDLVGPKRTLLGVRVLGPFRKNTQIEISRSDGFFLGINPPIRQSGDISKSEAIHVIGPTGAIKLEEGVICAARHIHMNPSEAERFGVKDKQVVAVQFFGKKAGILDEVMVRVNPNYSLELHLDLDEGNALNLKNSDLAMLLKNFDNRTYSPFR